MKHAYLEVTPELLVEFCKPLREAAVPVRVHTVENCLPEDATIVRCFQRDHYGSPQVCIVLHSELFSEIGPGAQLPRLPDPVLRVERIEGQ